MHIPDYIYKFIWFNDRLGFFSQLIKRSGQIKSFDLSQN